jgi:hypothetical protein
MAGAGNVQSTAAEAHGREEAEPAEASASADQLGRVTYLTARVDVPVVPRLSIAPQAELLRVNKATAEDRTIVREMFGLGATYRPSDTWSVELTGMYGPRAFDIESAEAMLAVSHEVGADWEHNVRPRAEIELALGVGRFHWEDGLGPAGPDVTQLMIEAKELWRVTHRLELTPQGMFFLYDKSLDRAVGDRLGSAMVLARVGAFAPPLALAGARAGYIVTPWLTPLVEVDEILYASRSGDATELLGGATLHFGGSRAGWLLAGGVLLNRAHGALVPDELANKSLPVAMTELQIRF